MTNLFTYETFVRAMAGASGSIFAMSVFYPLDTIRIRMQLEDSNANELKKLNTFEAIWFVIKTEGLEALYRGILPVLQSVGTSNFVYFYVFHGLKKLNKTTSLGDLSLGIIAGIANVLITLPLWVVNSRLKVEKTNYSGLLDGMVHVASTEGLNALWNGLGPSLMLVINPAIQFTLYEYLKRRWPSAKTATSFFALGALAKAAATIATYPIQLVQARQRHGKDSNVSTAALLLAILKRNGFAALFQGLEAKLLQTVLTAALMFVTYEKVIRFVFMILMSSPKINN